MTPYPPGITLRLSDEDRAALWWLAQADTRTQRATVSVLLAEELARRGVRAADIRAAWDRHQAQKQDKPGQE